MVQTLDQKRAQFAWKEASNGVGKAGKEYVNMTKGASAFIMSSGLMQALAFYQSRGDKNSKQASLLLGSVCGWLKEAGITGSDAGFAPTMDRLMKLTSTEYMRATEETLAMLRWLRQFADALKKTDQSGAPTHAK